MSVCPRCGAAFECGMAECTPEPCWCTRLPPLAPDASAAEAAACYCPACLRLLSSAIPGRDDCRRD